MLQIKTRLTCHIVVITRVSENVFESSQRLSSIHGNTHHDVTHELVNSYFEVLSSALGCFFCLFFFLIQFTGKRDITCISEFTTISLTELRDSKIAERETLTQDLLGKKRIEKFMSGNKCHSG